MLSLFIVTLIVGILAYHRVSLSKSTAMIVASLVLLTVAQGLGIFLLFIWVIALAILAVLNLTDIRKQYISQHVLNWMRNALPHISQTEQEALDAGRTWWDAELFSGKPDWSMLRDKPAARLSEKEQTFLDGPVQELCEMLDDWDITHNRKDLPPQVWDHIKKHRFFGMIIPEQYDGLEFSDLAHSEVVMKIASRSVTAAVTVMVPNSLGPAKLLLTYGSEQEKEYFLPRLSRGEEIPCFALTSPAAGSDAASIEDQGVVCRGTFDGEDDVLGIRLNWEKRYITLGPVATMLGLAFKLYDPDKLLGEQKDLGITLALIPTNLPGIDIGNRHYPLNIPFQNGPNRGKDVFIPMSMLIGSQEYIGQGWRMLMECLADGRAISLPALSTGAGKVASRITGAYARIRKQFGISIGRFEGIEEPLARIAGNTYIMDAARKVTATALDTGEKPSVISAILKYELTERMRHIINDAMDIHGGSGICLGPTNYLGRVYQAVPISITVEGANILTRSLIIFGQGAIRNHPWLLQEIHAAENPDHQQGLEQFDYAIWSHAGFLLSNLVRSFWLGLSNTRFTRSPGDHNTRRYYQQLTRLSAGLALLTDAAMIALGGTLKRKERISGRFADVISNLYLCSCALKQYEDNGSPQDEVELMHWACRSTIHRAQQSMLALLWNYPFRPVAMILRFIVFPYGKVYAPANDRMIHKAASFLLNPSAARDRLSAGVYINDKENDPTGKIEKAFNLLIASEHLEQKLRAAKRDGLIKSDWQTDIVTAAQEQNILNDAEAKQLRAARQASRQAIMVDEFTREEL
jgi:acyl-CoA dehydrogenase